MRGRGWALAVAALISACAAPDDQFGNPGDGYLAATQPIAMAADWGKAEPIALELGEFGFSPEILRLRKGQAYALTLTNNGLIPHRFRAPEFFRAIAAKSLVYSDAETSFPRLKAIALAVQETKTLYLVPALSGDYHVSCDQPFHAVLGMSGRILIE